jgi:hypothetical protein
MAYWGIYGGLILFAALLSALGIQGFTKRVQS